MNSSESSFCIGVDLGGADSLPLELLNELEQSLSHVPLRCYVPEVAVPRDSKTVPSHQLVFSSEEIRMGEKPFLAVRRKRDSSLMLGLADLRQHKINLLVSLANTGALVLASSFILGRMTHVHCPALVGHFPSPVKEVAVLDLGASSNQTALRLEELVSLGVAYARARYGRLNPKVGILNIGREEIKGTKSLREIDSVLKSKPQTLWQYVGFIEPVDIFNGAIDVAVTDGFTGNVLLKTTEGVSEMLQPSQAGLKQYQAGLLLGVLGDVYKCHGKTSPVTLAKILLSLFQKNHNTTPFFQAFQKDLSASFIA